MKESPFKLQEQWHNEMTFSLKLQVCGAVFCLNRFALALFFTIITSYISFPIIFIIQSHNPLGIRKSDLWCIESYFVIKTKQTKFAKKAMLLSISKAARGSRFKDVKTVMKTVMRRQSQDQGQGDGSNCPPYPLPCPPTFVEAQPCPTMLPPYYCCPRSAYDVQFIYINDQPPKTTSKDFVDRASQVVFWTELFRGLYLFKYVFSLI